MLELIQSATWGITGISSAGAAVGLATLIRAIAIYSTSRALNRESDEKRRKDQLTALRILSTRRKGAGVRGRTSRSALSRAGRQ